METKTPRGIRNNNPLNIRFNSGNTWLGKVYEDEKKDKEFEEFQAMKYGYRAAAFLIHRYIEGGKDTVEAIINKWAPPSENQTGKYIYNVCRRSGLGRDTHIELSNAGQFLRLLDGMAFVENGRTPQKKELVRGYLLALAHFNTIVPQHFFDCLDYLECSGTIKFTNDK